MDGWGARPLRCLKAAFVFLVFSIGFAGRVASCQIEARDLATEKSSHCPKVERVAAPRGMHKRIYPKDVFKIMKCSEKKHFEPTEN